MNLQGVLAALLLREPAHGYYLKETLEAELGPVWVARASNVYLTVNRMVRDGLVKSKRIRQETRPDRQVLVLTDKGKEAARHWLFTAGPSEEMVVRLAVARLVVPSRFREVADGILEERTSTLRHLRELRVEAVLGFRKEAVDAEIQRAQADLRWVTAVRDRSADIVARPKAKRIRLDEERYA